MSRTGRAVGTSALLVLLAFGSSGCFDHAGTGVAAPQVSQVPFPNADDGVTPQLGLGARSRLHMPMSVGDQWEYALHVRFRSEDPYSGHATTVTVEHRGVSEIVSAGDSRGEHYSVLRRIRFYPLVATSDELAPLRVGEAGVFFLPLPYLDPNAPPPPGPAEPGAEPGESATLRFPLTLGARWRAPFAYEFRGQGLATVTSLDRVRVPAGVFIAWRVEIGLDGGDPADRHTYWYSDAGLVRESHRTVERLYDSQGFRRGQNISEWVTEWTAFRPAAP